MSAIDKIIDVKSVIITCGAGGVGKTTIAAAIGCYAAKKGRKVAVLTVDPARRLASSLGLDSFEENSEPIKIPTKDGFVTMDAMMLDNSSTFDRLVKKYAPNEEQAKTILANKFYRHFSGSVGGTHEYTAMERLYELSNMGKWDLLIMDTPPTVHALDFLDAPQRMIDLFDESIFKWVIKPYLAAGKVGVQVLSFGSAYIFKTLTKFVGGEMLQDLSEFLFLFQDLFEGFKSRAVDVQKLLHDDKTGFLIVATAQINSLKEASLFKRELFRMNLPFTGFVINRYFRLLDKCEDKNYVLKKLLENSGRSKEECEAFAERLFTAQEKYQSASMQQRETLSTFRNKMTKNPDTFSVPLFNRDVADIDSLIRVAESLAVEK